VLRILKVAPLVTEPANPRPWPKVIESLQDRESGIEVNRGQFVAYVTETPAEAAVIADRMGRYVLDVGQVLLNGVALDEYAVIDTRSTSW